MNAETDLYAIGIDSIPFDLVLWVGFGLALTIFALFSGILLWHWNLYSTGVHTTYGTMVVYLCGGAAFLGLMALASFWYTFS